MSDDIVDVWRKFYIRTWSDKRVMALSRPTPNGQTLLTWLIAGRQTGIIPGLFEIGERAFAELMSWPLHGGESLFEGLPKGLPKGFREAFAEVAAQGFVKADWNARLVYVPGALKLDPPSNPNMILKWRKAWRELPDCDLKDEARQAFRLFFERYSKGFQEAFGVVCGNPLANQDSGFRKQDSGNRSVRKAPAAQAHTPDKSLSTVESDADEEAPAVQTMREVRSTRGAFESLFEGEFAAAGLAKNTRVAKFTPIELSIVSQLFRRCAADGITQTQLIAEWWNPAWRNVMGWTIQQLEKHYPSVVAAIHDPKQRPKAKGAAPQVDVKRQSVPTHEESQDFLKKLEATVPADQDAALKAIRAVQSQLGISTPQPTEPRR